MSEAPEQIWIDNQSGVIVGCYDIEPFEGSIEYVRADRIEELEAKLAQMQEALAQMQEALAEAMIVPEAWMISGFPRMTVDAQNQIAFSVLKARAALAELKGQDDE